MTEREWTSHYNQVRNLPGQLARARAKVRHLENKAVRLGMAELIKETPCTGEAGPR